MSERNISHGVILVLGATSLLGIGVILYGLNRGPVQEESAVVPAAATAAYGQQLLRETTRLLGPEQPDPAMRYSGNGLDCASCHLESGTTPGTLSLLQSASRYPRFSGRDGGEGDLRDRINGCMQRSMNGKPLPRDSVEMIAMESYILGLGQQYNIMSDEKTRAFEPPAFVEPQRKASIDAGKVVYEAKCQVCHGADGLGLKQTADLLDGYLFPPLWGPESYNNGAGMTRVLTAARFIKARMPLGMPDLTDDQAYDVSAYINSQPRPIKAALEVDFPELWRKPVDSPYLPYADPFPQEQHQFGPFQPIRDYYEQLNAE